MRLRRIASSRFQQTVLSAFVLVAFVAMSADAQTIVNNGTGRNQGFWYALFTSSGSSTMTFSTQFAGNFNLNFSNVGDVVGGKGWNPGSPRTVNYNVGFASGYNNISVYGWTTSPLIEYYMCEFGSVAFGTNKGSVSSDGHTYTTFLHQQVNQPSIQGTATFNQYLDNWGGSSIGSNHAVTTGNHFNHWRSIGLPLGTFNEMIFEAEAFGGRSGSVNATTW